MAPGGEGEGGGSLAVGGLGDGGGMGDGGLGDGGLDAAGGGLAAAGGAGELLPGKHCRMGVDQRGALAAVRRLVVRRAACQPLAGSQAGRGELGAASKRLQAHA